MLKPAFSALDAGCVTVAQPDGSGPGLVLMASTICSESGGSAVAVPVALLLGVGVPEPCATGVAAGLCRSSRPAATPAPAPTMTSSTRAIHRPLRRRGGLAGPDPARAPWAPWAPSGGAPGGG